MESETRLVCLLVFLLAHQLGEISAATRCYECGTMFTPYCEDPIFLKSSMTYSPTLCKSLYQGDSFASEVIRYFITYMTDVTEEMSGNLDLEGQRDKDSEEFEDEEAEEEEVKEEAPAPVKKEKAPAPDKKKKPKRSAIASWLDLIAPAFRISQRSKRQILSSIPGNWSLRKSEKSEKKPAKEPAEKPAKESAKKPAEEPEEVEEVDVVLADNSDDLSDSGPDEFKCYKLVFANMRDELEEFRGCVLPSLFDVCDLLINFNEKSKQRVVFCELCQSDLVDKDHPPCNQATTLGRNRKLTFLLAFSLISIVIMLRFTV